MEGSSPLSRGIRIPPKPAGCTSGIIPALAGNTRMRQLRRRTAQDHPRSRGEYTQALHPRLISWGSSPLSRGIPLGILPAFTSDGIIPALAGNTALRSLQSRPRPDHPRSRGEYGLVHHYIRQACGSSPLSRGILHHVASRQLTGRIIPALAGNTGQPCPLASPCRDHPRSRGEYIGKCPYEFLETRSSPLSRGIP